MLRIVLLLYFLSYTASFQLLGVHLPLPIKSRPLSSRLFATPDPVPQRELERSPPPYEPSDKALVVFSNKYFYGSEEYMELSRGEREKVLGNLTVGDVYDKFVLENNQDVQVALLLLANVIRALVGPIMKYYASANVPPEKVLAEEGIVDLTDGGEMILYKNRMVAKLPSFGRVWSATKSKLNSRNQDKRELPLALVLGPSGSGKTFFSLDYLGSKLENEDKSNRVTVYLKPPSTVKFDKQTNSKAAEYLLQWIKKEITRKKGVSFERPLGMHVCIVIDEAGAEDVKWWFEEKDMLTALCGEARKLAESVAVVISGTGLTGRNLNSGDDAFFFRMQRWARDDLASILDKRNDNEIDELLLEAHETVETVAEAIFSHPELGALATNGRAAFFLSQAIKGMSNIYSRVSWPYQLDEWAPSLVSQVVMEYSSANGIKSLTRMEKYCVAASIFRALENLKAGEAVLPKLEGIEQGKVTAVASSLLQYNLEIDGTMKIIKGELFAFTVTPAIVIVLYAMAGISTSLMSGWEAEESIAALYAYRQLMLKCMESSLLTANVLEMEQSNFDNRNRYDELAQSLSRLRLVVLRTRIQTQRNLAVPMLGAGTVIVNGGKASFVDVIAPYCLIQAKRATKEQYVDFDLLGELRKSCLAVRTGQDDTRLLQGLVAMWQGNLDPVKFLQKGHYANPKEGLDQQISKAFPGNLLGVDTKTENEKIRFARIRKVGATEITIDKRTKIPLPSLEGTTWTFLVSTNAKTINVKLSSEVTLKITEAHLDNDLSLDTKKLSQPQRLAWESFRKNNVRQGVTIRFLFTRSVQPKPLAKKRKSTSQPKPLAKKRNSTN